MRRSRRVRRVRRVAGQHARHAWASCAERAGRRVRYDICDLPGAMAGFFIFQDVSSALRLGRRFYPAQGFHHRPTRELSQVDLPRRTPFRSVNHDFWCPCDCILLCWPTRSHAAIAARRNCSARRRRPGSAAARDAPRPGQSPRDPSQMVRHWHLLARNACTNHDKADVKTCILRHKTN